MSTDVRHFGYEATTERALDGATGVIGAEAEKERGAHIEPFEEVCEAWYAFACPAIRIHVDFERDAGHPPTRHRMEYTQYAAVAAEEIKAIPLRKKTRLQWWRQDSRLEQSTVNPPALAVDFAERTGKRGRDRAHEIVNFNGGTGPHDAAIFRAAASKILTWLDRRLSDINAGAADTQIDQLTALNDQLLLVASDNTHGAELWRSAESTQDTICVADIYPGPESSRPRYLTEAGSNGLFPGEGSSARICAVI